jgi:hypothetical protein
MLLLHRDFADIMERWPGGRHPAVWPVYRDFAAVMQRMAMCAPGRCELRPGGPHPAIWAVVALHLAVIVMTLLWPLVVSRTWDGLFILYVMLVSWHWTLCKGECVLSYLEKRCMYVAYEMGEAPLRHCFHETLPLWGSAAVHIAVFACLNLAILCVLLRNVTLTSSSMRFELLAPPLWS